MMFKSVFNNFRARRGILVCVLVLLVGPVLWAAGKKEQIETVTAEGGQVWQNNYDISGRKTGKYNYIVNAEDRAGNTAVSGPFNVFVNPLAGLPVARVVFPENGTVLRQNISLIGVASGRFGVSRVTVRLDDGDAIIADGTEYWSKTIDVANVPEGKHTIHVEAFDSKGMSGGAQSVSFILDKGPPSLALESHQVGDLISGNITVRGVADDPNGVARLEFSADGKNFKTLAGRAVRNSTAQKFSFDVRAKSMADGPVVYYVRAHDTTGLVTTKPFLFFVDNKGPELEILSPASGEDVFGEFLLSGRVFDVVGLSRLYYTWGGKPVDIEIRPGDPFWSVELEKGPKSPSSVRVTAVDKSGNVDSVTWKLDDRRKVKTPVLVIDYPPAAVLAAMPADASIYGHIAPGIEPLSVTVGGIGDIPARSAFRISPEQIMPGKSTLKITPKGVDNSVGAALSLKINKLESGAAAVSQITVSSPEQFSWVSGSSFALRGSVSGPSQIEYRLGPEDNWKLASVDSRGGFNATVSIAGIGDGPIHLELRGRAGDIPVYHPLNHASGAPELRFIAPTMEGVPLNGNITVLGEIDSATPVISVAYTLDGRDYDDIPFVSRYGKTWFSYFCDFTALNATGRKLVVRVTDMSGASVDRSPDFRFDAASDIPSIIVNTPEDGEVITEAFNISGIAFDDDEVAAVYWRVLGPKPESIPPGLAGNTARAAAAAWVASPNVPFKKFETKQNFSIPIDFSVVIDGEYTVEVYADDLYGVKSAAVSRTIKVSSAPPETRIIEPVISRYNHKAIMVKGFSSDANGISSVSLSMDSGNTFQRAKVAPDGNWELPLNTVAYRDGIYSALIRTMDNYGVISFVSAMLNIDNTPPELDISSPANGQHIGTDMSLMGRVQDNVALKSLSFQIISAANPNYQRNFDIPPQLVIFESMSLAGFPQGDYIVRVAAKDLSDNETVVSRKVVYDADDVGAEIAIFNPLSGEVRGGPLSLAGTVSGSFTPPQITLKLNNESTIVDVDRYGVFRYTVKEEQLAEAAVMVVSATYNSQTGKPINSPRHTVHYSNYGPTLVIESHEDGDYITKRPWLSGRAWIEAAPSADGSSLTRAEKAGMALKQVLVSYDNGRSFKEAAIGGSQWKFRLETSTLPLGPQPVVVKAQFANGEEAVRRLLLVVDTLAPTVATISPPEGSIHRDDLLVYGTAEDNFELSSVDISLRPNDKFWYSVPGPIQGLYVDAKAFGATWFDVGLGLTVFDDNVRLQGQFGIAPDDGVDEVYASGGRFIGQVWGFKLLANVFYLPFSYLFGLDWEFYSMSVAVGANFSYFLMGDGRNPAWIGAIIAQWEVAHIEMQYFYPNWKYFHNFAVYLEPEFWFISSDVEASTDFRLTVGLRWNFF